jgi:hypothetical protein
MRSGPVLDRLRVNRAVGVSPDVFCGRRKERGFAVQYLHSITESGARISRLEQALRDALPGWTLTPLVQALQALRGVLCPSHSGGFGRLMSQVLFEHC